MKCGAMMNAGTTEELDVQQCVQDAPHPGRDHVTAAGEAWDEDDPRAFGF